MSANGLLTSATGPGGTQFFERPKPLGRNEVPGPQPTALSVPERTACHLRQAVEDAMQALAAGENAQREGLRLRLETAQHDRQEFWMDTCREAREMRTPSPQARELYRQHGCCFGTPDSRQVQYILEALDSALPGWERDHPELFYQTLRLNFPELPKRRH
jgi:hypothetical protein